MSLACGRLAWGSDGAIQEGLAIRPSQPPPSGLGIHRAVGGSFLVMWITLALRECLAAGASLAFSHPAPTRNCHSAALAFG